MEQKPSSEADRDLHVKLGQAQVALDADAPLWLYKYTQEPISSSASQEFPSFNRK
jgi:hypothetical protein